jgi:creatinine amidohydrolase/Fe(II)-dependent formamide hydrolase-like protein
MQRGGLAPTSPISSRSLAALTRPDTAAFPSEESLLAVPVASTEQHGPHLPLSTATGLAVELCTRLASVRNDVLVAPAEILPMIRATSVKAVSRNGVLGDPAGTATREGRRLLRALLADLVETVSSGRSMWSR